MANSFNIVERRDNRKTGGSSGSVADCSRLPTCRQHCDVFVVYSASDESWVTGTLLDIVYLHYPCYDVMLQHHVTDTSSNNEDETGEDVETRGAVTSDRKWNCDTTQQQQQQTVLGNIIDNSQVFGRLLLSVLGIETF